VNPALENLKSPVRRTGPARTVFARQRAAEKHLGFPFTFFHQRRQDTPHAILHPVFARFHGKPRALISSVRPFFPIFSGTRCIYIDAPGELYFQELEKDGRNEALYGFYGDCACWLQVRLIDLIERVYSLAAQKSAPAIPAFRRGKRLLFSGFAASRNA
jgi:hypothetical protein